MSNYHPRLTLLRQPAFALYVISFSFAAFGNGLGYIAASWIVMSMHTHVTSMVILMASFWIPTTLFGPFAGVLADRLPRKNLVIISHFLRAAIFIFFSIYLRYHDNPTVVYIMMFFNGLAFTLFYATATSFMRELVPKKQLMYANSTVDIMYEIGSVFGMGFAGLLIGFTSSETAVLINGLMFVISTLSTMAISPKALCHGDKKIVKKIQVLEDMHEGLRYLTHNKKLLSIYTVQLFIFMTFLTAPLLLLPFSKLILKVSVTQFGIIESAMSAGVIIGGVLMPAISEKAGLFRTLIFFSSILLVTFLLFGFNRWIPFAIIMNFMVGFAGAIWPLVITRAQNLTDLNFQGRVQSTFNTLSGVLMLFFYVFVGAIGNYYAVEKLYMIEVVITAMAIVFLWRSKESF